MRHLIKGKYLSRTTTKPTKWPVPPAKTRSSLGAQSDQSLLLAWRNNRSLATNTVHSEDSDQTAGRTIFCWFCHALAHLVTNLCIQSGLKKTDFLPVQTDKTDSICIKHIFFSPKTHTLRIIIWPNYLDWSSVKLLIVHNYSNYQCLSTHQNYWIVKNEISSHLVTSVRI